MEKYVGERAKDLIKTVDLPKMIRDILSAPNFEDILVEKLTKLAATEDGKMLNMMAPMFGGIKGLVPKIKPMIVGFAADMGDLLVDNFDPLKMIPIDKVRAEIERLMEEKLKLLTPESVKTLMEEVIRSHLGWLIVWGNVFGSLIGVVSVAFGYP